MKKVLNNLLILVLIFGITYLITFFILSPSYLFKSSKLSFKTSLGVAGVYIFIFLIKVIAKEKIERESYAILKGRSKFNKFIYHLIFYLLILGAIFGLLSQ